MFYVLVALGAYLIGSFPSGYLIARARGVDIRTMGSGNVGATNVFRVLGKKWGYLCFALDIGKGALAVWLGWHVPVAWGLVPTTCAIISACAVMIGHTFPVWLGFKGGKGIATSGGIAIALFPIEVFVISVSVWIIAFFVSRIVSVASLTGAFTLSILLVVDFVLGRADMALMIVGIVMTALVFWLHRGNLRRLRAGTEPRFERKRPV
ncbi:MAG: glycerol-3-phosphate 1-O-acyltransferase PlsY [Chthoniobacterales bacterium]